MAFRFIHAADPHLDSPLLGLGRYEGAPVDALRGATRQAFSQLVTLAIEEKVGFVLLAGDVFDRDGKDHHTALFFRSKLAELADNRIPVFTVAGNHDAASVITKRLSMPSNHHFFSTRAAESLPVPDLPVIVHGRGFPNREVSENFAAGYPEAVEGRFNIGLLHTSLNGRPGHDPYAPCSAGDLRAKRYQYWALGHIHQPEIISKDPWIVFAGNCQGRHAGETGPRGCCLVSVDDGLQVVGHSWRHLDRVRWERLRVDLAGAASEEEALRRIGAALAGAVTGADGRLLACRIILTGATELHGSLHQNSGHWRAQILGQAQDSGPGAVWVEKIENATSPVYDPAKLAERDGLTKMVLEALSQEQASGGELPEDIQSLLNALPPGVQREMEVECGPGHRARLFEDVRAMILETLASKPEPA